VAAVYDAVGRDTFLDSLRTLRPRGTLVMFGKASGDPPLLDPFLLAPKSLYVTWPIRTASQNLELLRQAFALRNDPTSPLQS
jgi:NADPH:quinone reductase-like Zn-dependent oxidoreductase